ncbi:hypothetical protein DPMN_153085 [Dreissena polymorpha]|uniref:GP-PDE domain-containing protein n=1 Tax=Dreissena polymorpha TaxID=45954 RepID=A0A9D4J906_DREPO|nr:hypothetical protein DPMN_153085 [Dreissena polymorpha]
MYDVVYYFANLQDGTGNLSGYFDMNRFVDIILASVFKNHAGRRIIFSSFEPDVCSM